MPAPLVDVPPGTPLSGGITPEEIRAMQLRGYAPKVTTPVMPVTTGRPDVNALYDQLALTERKPPDYSGLETIGKSRQESARRDLGVGMALSALGGESMKGAGGHILTQALEAGKPLRANAADVGYMDDTTGKFVENPMMHQNREEKLITGRIDALIKEQESKARIAIAQGNAADAQVAKQNANSLTLLAASIAQQNADTARTRAATAGAAAGKLKPVSGILTPEGGPVYHDPERQAFVSGSGDIVTNPLSVGEHQKRENTMREGAETYTVAKSLIEQVEKNPKAFGMAATVAGALPETLGIQSRALQATLNTAEQQTRAAVLKDAYKTIHDLTGAVLSMGESKRMTPFVPGPNDPPEMTINKLKGAMQLYETVLKERGLSGFGGKKPTAPKLPAAPATPAAVSDEDLLKLYAPKAP